MNKRFQGLAALAVIGMIFGVTGWAVRRAIYIAPHPRDEVFLEVVLDSEHPGALLCNKPNAKLVPCTVEVRGDGWAVHFQEKP